MTTIKEIRIELGRRGKQFTRPGVYYQLVALNIKPITRHAKPALYPDNSAERIAKRLRLPALIKSRRARA